MAEKVKVSQDIADAIEYMRERLTDANIIDARYDEKFQFALEGQPLNDVPPLELTKIILNGYEIEQTPEEKILAEYNRLKDLLEKTNDELMKESCKSSMFSIEFTLNRLKVYIKGINE